MASNTVDSKKGWRRNQSHRSPLKEHNVITSSCSSSTSSVSNEVPKGCLRFFLSNTSSSRTPLNNRPRSTAKTPKSAPSLRPSNLSRSKPSKENLSKPIISANHERPTSHKLQKSKNNTPCLYQWQQYGKKPSFRIGEKAKPSPNSNISDIYVTNQSYEPEELEQQLDYLVRRVGDSDAGEVNELVMSDMKDVNFTPASKLPPFGSSLDCAFLDKVIRDENSNTNITTTPPVEASVSPEIQCGLPLVSSTTTPICYGAGHVLSGVTDRRKCKPRGILTIGKNSLEFDKAKIFYGDDNDEQVLGAVSNSRVSLVPLPIEASMHWLLSPCNEEDEVQIGLCDDGSNRFRRLANSSTAHSPSPSSGQGICSNVCNSSSNASAGTTTISCRRRRRRSNSLLSPSGLHGLFSPIFDEMGSLPSSPHATPTCKAIVSEEERYELSGKNSPFSLNSLGSGNVIQTPQSDSGPDRDIDPCLLNTKHLFESEVDSVVAVLQTTSFSPNSKISMWDPAGSSFEFDHLTTPSNSIDFMQLQKTWDQTSWISNSRLENVSQSKMRISWREGLVSRMFEMDELDCCRCLSDEEEDGNGCGNDEMLIFPSASGEEFSYEGASCCAESISTDGGGLVASGDSDWSVWYRNRLFEG